MKFPILVTHWMRRALMAVAAAALAGLLSACGTPMPLSAKTKQLDLSRESIALLTLEQTREGSRTMPWPRQLFIKDLATGKNQMVAVDTTFMDYGEDSRTYLTPLRLALPPGRYRIEQVGGTLSAFPIQGSFTVPLALEFEVPAGSVFYVGRIHAHMRERKDTEFRAGSLMPLISQAALGVATSTFDVTVSDASAKDVSTFKEAFPVLQDVTIATRLLPAFDRAPFDRAYAAPDSPAASSAPAASASAAR
jgi:hypothetical protein